MLRNGLAHTLDYVSARASRFVDLFAGSGAVAAYVATRKEIPVLACDLQKFSAVLTSAVIGRKKKVDAKQIWKHWVLRAGKIAARYTPPVSDRVTRVHVDECRKWSASRRGLPITKAYGGHYFSPEQAVWIDALRKSLPARNPNRTVALAALIQAASECAASPGHTAQPFQPTRSAGKFLREAWGRDVCERIKRILKNIADAHALTVGEARVADANRAIAGLQKDDLVFIDPPYSGVHYSRFYHVLETIARGKCGPVSGVGRYPHAVERPHSRYSVRSESVKAFTELLQKISEKNASAIITFPAHECSNGLSGRDVKNIARRFFHVRTKSVNSKFSTLGGTRIVKGEGNGRAARQHAKELILVLSPKHQVRSSRIGRS